MKSFADGRDSSDLIAGCNSPANKAIPGDHPAAEQIMRFFFFFSFLDKWQTHGQGGKVNAQTLQASIIIIRLTSGFSILPRPSQGIRSNGRF